MKIKSNINNHDDDLALWQDLRDGNEKSFSIIFEKYYPHLIRYGNSFSPFTEKVQDCVQDVFADLWLYRSSLNETVFVKAYLLSSVRKRMTRLQERDYIFNKSTSLKSIDFLTDFSIEHDLIADETTAYNVANMNNLINSLPARQKEALFLRYHHGLGIDEIADTLQVNYQSANNLLYRAVLNLRKGWKEKLLLILALSTILF
ncbi:RNA polymerase sigma factor, sigma-70 family [Flavobacterium segetis]|uniref:RNA polymerase sigma factor, sigma-70 family n=1 Tax=Flavobacterium segetis TaxID=271157 RepID=A0A1M5E861_9FLAO|nr:sigma-70 family RNA polymerase sigma factor [Flavobacterium segetis]SHF75429.1 RNA polymerase sigma factor, sigma-70 family [Flavobacterium segetis]